MTTRTRLLATYGLNENNYTYEARTANAQLTLNDNNKVINITANSFTQTIVSISTLPIGYTIHYFNSGTGTITFDPLNSETVNGASSLSIVANSYYIISNSTGSGFSAQQIYAGATAPTLNTSAYFEGGGNLASPVTINVKNQVGPFLFGRSAASSGAVTPVSAPMLGIITAADKSSALDVLGATPITNNNVQSLNASASMTIDLSLGHVINIALGTDITTLAFSNVPDAVKVVLNITKDNSTTARSIVWPTSIVWDGDTYPTIDATEGFNLAVQILTVNSGTLWKGSGKVYYNNKLWVWGRNDYGQLGLGDVTLRSSPVQVGNLTNWDKISSSYHTVLIDTKGYLLTFGLNDYGELGSGDIIKRSSPIQIGNLTDWSNVNTGYLHTVAIKTDRSLWSWGYNAYGQLGLGNNINRSSPVQVGSLINWNKVSCGDIYTLAIKTDGTLWGFGGNDQGQLGLGDVTHRSSPVQVGNLTNWNVITCSYDRNSLAIKTDGTLWSWGANSYGCLGLGDITSRSSPVQVGSLTNWSKVSCDYQHTLAVKTDGTLWSWGRNDYGQLGLGDISNRSSPCQVGNLTNWYKICNGIYHSMVIKTDGTLWSWGRNDSGQLGLGDVTHRSSPVQVGNLTNWKSVECAYYSTLAIQST